MDRILLILIFLIFISCSSEQEKTTNDDKDTINRQTSTEIEMIDSVVESNTSGRREYFDSAHFHIIRGWYVSGAKFIDVYENRKNKIDSWVEYYENGNTKKKGLITTSNHHYIGKWEYYSNEGKLDSIIDFDIKQPISYFKAISIAKEKGFEMPDMEVTKTYEDGRMYWEVSRWTEMESGGGRTFETILIDSETGKVTKPEYQKDGIY